jgi:hypothetical protein
MRATSRALLCFALLLPLSGTLAAQHRGLRPVDRDEGNSAGSGFWVTVGLASGQERYRFDSDADWHGHFRANSFLLSAGGKVSPDVGLGLEWNSWSDYEADSDQRLQALSLVANWYPMGSPIFLKGGIGLASNRIDDATGVFKDSGYGVTFGAGIDIPIAQHVAIQPRIDYYGQRYDSPGQANDYRERLTQVGVAVRFR